MITIYEKETLFESLDDTFTEIKAYVEGAIGQAELHEVEQNLFRRLQGLGRGFMETFVALSGTGYEAGHPPLSEAGQPMVYKGIEAEGSPYLSIFGEIRIYRAGTTRSARDGELAGPTRHRSRIRHSSRGWSNARAHERAVGRGRCTLR